MPRSAAHSQANCVRVEGRGWLNGLGQKLPSCMRVRIAKLKAVIPLSPTKEPAAASNAPAFKAIPCCSGCRVRQKLQALQEVCLVGPGCLASCTGREASFLQANLIWSLTDLSSPVPPPSSSNVHSPAPAREAGILQVQRRAQEHVSGERFRDCGQMPLAQDQGEPTWSPSQHVCIWGTHPWS